MSNLHFFPLLYAIFIFIYVSYNYIWVHLVPSVSKIRSSYPNRKADIRIFLRFSLHQKWVVAAKPARLKNYLHSWMQIGYI